MAEVESRKLTVCILLNSTRTGWSAMLRDFAEPGRSMAVSSECMVATSHPLATLAALELLREGGNAVDAAICAAAVQSVADPAMTGIGGDCFVLYSKGGSLPQALNASGRASENVDPEWFANACANGIEQESVHSVTVPGAVDGWCRLHDRFGSVPLDRIFAPAIKAAKEGYRITPRVAFDWFRNATKLKRDAACAEQYLPGGQAPGIGDIICQPALAQTLERIAKHGRAAFYEGEVAHEIVAKLRAEGGVLTESDFAAQTSEWVQPISTRYRGHEVYECPPNGQGVTALMMLRMLDKCAVSLGGLAQEDEVHRMAEITKAAYSSRDRGVGDPAQTPMNIEQLLSDEVIERMISRISREKASPPEAFDQVEHKDTVYIAVVDKDRNSVSFINSLFSAFGCGIYAPHSGVLLHNRGTCFSTKLGHPNGIAPRRRPLHTIIPGMLYRDGKAVMPFGVMGGHYQATGHAHFLARVLDVGLDIQSASEQPRSFAVGGKLQLEKTISPAVAEKLSQRGHEIEWVVAPLGGCQAILIDDSVGALYGATDHRKDGIALGF
jgi:gamma-glutamyltranspeptidase/glutathione hydrolase